MWPSTSGGVRRDARQESPSDACTTSRPTACLARMSRPQLHAGSRTTEQLSSTSRSVVVRRQHSRRSSGGTSRRLSRSSERDWEACATVAGPGRTPLDDRRTSADDLAHSKGRRSTESGMLKTRRAQLRCAGATLQSVYSVVFGNRCARKDGGVTERFVELPRASRIRDFQ